MELGLQPKKLVVVFVQVTHSEHQDHWQRQHCFLFVTVKKMERQGKENSETARLSVGKNTHIQSLTLNRHAVKRL